MTNETPEDSDPTRDPVSDQQRSLFDEVMPPEPAPTGPIPLTGQHPLWPAPSAPSDTPAAPQQQSESASEFTLPDYPQPVAEPPVSPQPVAERLVYEQPAYGQPAYVQSPPATPEGAPLLLAGAPVPQKSRMSKGLLFAVIGGAAAFALLVAALVAVPLLLRGPTLTASDVVENYLTALAAGDVETALTYTDVPEEALVSPQVLAASIARAPLTDIVVEQIDGGGTRTTVPTSFTIGGEEVSRDFTVWQIGDEWTVSDAFIPVNLIAFTGLDLTINGAAASEFVYLFPGSYEFALDSEDFVIGGGPGTAILATDADVRLFYHVMPTLSDAGVSKFRTLVRESLASCLAMTTLSTPCGMDLTDIDLEGYAPVEGTVKRTLTADGETALNAMKPSSRAFATEFYGYESIGVDMTLMGEKDGETLEFEVLLGGYPATPKVDFTVADPVVVWE